jgi:hypothetical protein
MSIAYRITKAKQEKKELIHKEELKKLSDMALDIAADNFILYPELTGLPNSYKIKIYDKIKLDHPIEIIFPLITYEGYWKRACNKRYKSANSAYHGNSWRQCYAENYVKDLINSNPDATNCFELFKTNVFNLQLNYYSAEFDISKVMQYFFNLISFELKYSPNLLDKEKESFLNRKLSRNLSLSQPSLKNIINLDLD